MILDSDLAIHRKKISEIYERKFFNRRERNEYGEWQWTEKMLLYKRPVNVVSSGIRLVHLLIDYYALSFGLSILTLILVHDSESQVLNYLPLIGFFGHFVAGEYYFQKTIGKFLTRSIVVNEWGEPPDFKTVVLRTLIRLVPLEPFSHLGSDRGWHDRWTNTYVLRKEELKEIRRLLQENETADDETVVL